MGAHVTHNRSVGQSSSAASRTGGSRVHGVVWKVVATLAAIALAITGSLWWWLGRSEREDAAKFKENAKFKTEWECRERRGAKAADNGHTKVQLWAGGPYWADTNIGAEKPWESGYAFSWGATRMPSDGSGTNVANFSSNSWKVPTHDKNVAKLRSEGWITMDGVLAPKHDAAHVEWGGAWRIPTDRELKDLCRNCDWTWTMVNGVSGCVVRGRGDYASFSIFLPCADGGGGTSASVNSVLLGSYWSSVPDLDGSYNAWGLVFGSDDHHGVSLSDRFLGFSVRPVQGFTK